MSTAPVVKIAGTGAAAATWTTASYTPQANSREVAYISAFKSTAGVALPTISDSAGNNWTLLFDYEITVVSNPNIRGAWFISDDVGASPAARTVTVAATGSNSMAVVIADVLSADTDGTIVQSAAGEDATAGDPSCTLGSTPGATNIVLAGASFGGGNTATARPTGFTQLANFNHSTARANSASYDVASATAGPLTYTSLNIKSIILAIELAPATAGGAMVGSSSLSFTTSGTSKGAGALGGSSSLAFTTSSTLKGTGAVIGSSSLVFAPSGTILGLIPAVGSSSLTFSPSGTIKGSGALVASSSLTFAPSGTMIGAGVLAGTSTLTFISSSTLLGDGVLAGSSALAFSPTGILTGGGALIASSSVTFTPSGTLTSLAAPGAMIGTSSLTFTPVGVLTGDGILVGSSSLTFALTGDMSPSLIGTTSITFITSGTLSGLQSPYGFSSGTSPDGLYESNSGDGLFLYYETSGTNPTNPYEEN